MEYLKIDGNYPSLSGTAVTLGKFDGIHRGHRRLIRNVLERKTLGEQAVLFAVDASEKLILTRQERASLLEEMGLDILIENPLDERFRSIRAETFVREILVGDLGVSYVTVGEDFRFGFERKGTPELLRKLGGKYGFEVQIVPREMDGHRKISSTYIREELRRGNMEKISFLMGMDYFVEGDILHGQGLGHRKLLPTINMIPSRDKHMPPNGVYFTVSHFEHQSFRGMTNVGTKPTVGGDFIGIETYLFDCDEDLYGKKCRVDFLHYERAEHRFDSLEHLKKQLLRDCEEGKKYFETRA